MTGEKVSHALARIDAAVARIDTAAARGASGDAELARKHAALREVVGQSLRELDSLIGGATQ